MEPFGLFQFLQSLLAKPEDTAASEPISTTQKEPDTTPAKAVENPAETSGAQNAFLEFISAHDTRAKNTKKH